MKSLDELQQEQKELLADLEHPRIGEALALFEEVGELAKEIMEIEMYGESHEEELGSEMADVLFCLFSLCNDYDINLSKVYEGKYKVIQGKIPDWRAKYADKLRILRAKHD